MSERFQAWGLRTGGLSLAQTTQARESSKVFSILKEAEYQKMQY